MASVQSDAELPEGLDQSAFEVDRDDEVLSPKHRPDTNRLCFCLDLSENNEVTFIALVTHEGVDDRKRRPI